jgi:hypothetical protein
MENFTVTPASIVNAALESTKISLVIMYGLFAVIHLVLTDINPLTCVPMLSEAIAFKGQTKEYSKNANRSVLAAMRFRLFNSLTRLIL